MAEPRPLTDWERKVLREGWGTQVERTYLEALDLVHRTSNEFQLSESHLSTHRAAPELQALAGRPDADALRWFVTRCFERGDQGPIFKTNGPEGAICEALWRHLERQQKASRARAAHVAALKALARAEAARAAQTPTKQGTGGRG